MRSDAAHDPVAGESRGRVPSAGTDPSSGRCRSRGSQWGKILGHGEAGSEGRGRAAAGRVPGSAPGRRPRRRATRAVVGSLLLHGYDAERTPRRSRRGDAGAAGPQDPRTGPRRVTSRAHRAAGLASRAAGGACGAGVPEGTLGLELDVLPAARYLDYAARLPTYELADCSAIVRRLRSVKSGWELERIREAGWMLAGIGGCVAERSSRRHGRDRARRRDRGVATAAGASGRAADACLQRRDPLRHDRSRRCGGRAGRYATRLSSAPARTPTSARARPTGRYDAASR